MGYQSIFTNEPILQVSTQGELVSNKNACGGFSVCVFVFTYPKPISLEIE